MEYQPPPFFKQGPSALARLLFFATLAFALLIADARFNALLMVRQVLATALYPLQRAIIFPTRMITLAENYFVALDQVEHENEVLRREKLAMAKTALLAQQLHDENEQLRRLLDTRQQQTLPSVTAEILYDARDAFSRKVVIDRGSNVNIKAGQPVIDSSGVVGQVTRVFPFNAEVTLLTDKDHAIPVQIVRSGLRAVVFGGAEGERLEVRFMASNADVQKDDVLVTSGLDGVYPAGLPVARVEKVNRAANDAFAKIICIPAGGVGGIDRDRHVLILLTEKIVLPAAPIEPRANKREARAKKNDKPEKAHE